MLFQDLCIRFTAKNLTACDILQFISMSFLLELCRVLVKYCKHNWRGCKFDSDFFLWLAAMILTAWKLALRAVSLTGSMNDNHPVTYSEIYWCIPIEVTLVNCTQIFSWCLPRSLAAAVRGPAGMLGRIFLVFSQPWYHKVVLLVQPNTHCFSSAMEH